MIEVNYTYNARVVRVIDGDSLEVSIDLGFDTFTIRPVRLARVNAPELNSKDVEVRKMAIWARDFLADQVLGKPVFLQSKKFDKYGRSLAEIYFGKDNDNLSDLLLEAGLAVPYDGGKR